MLNKNNTIDTKYLILIHIGNIFLKYKGGFKPVFFFIIIGLFKQLKTNFRLSPNPSVATTNIQ